MKSTETVSLFYNKNSVMSPSGRPWTCKLH